MHLATLFDFHPNRFITISKNINYLISRKKMQHLKSSNINAKSENLSNLLSISSQPPSECQTIPASENQSRLWEVKYKKKKKKTINTQGSPFAGLRS